MIKKTGKSLTENTVNNFHTELYEVLESGGTEINHSNIQNKLTAHLLIFNQVTSLLNHYLHD